MFASGKIREAVPEQQFAIEQMKTLHGYGLSLPAEIEGLKAQSAQRLLEHSVPRRGWFGLKRRA